MDIRTKLINRINQTQSKTPVEEQKKAVKEWAIWSILVTFSGALLGYTSKMYFSWNIALAIYLCSGFLLYYFVAKIHKTSQWKLYFVSLFTTFFIGTYL